MVSLLATNVLALHTLLHSDSSGALQHSGQLLLLCLELRVAADVLLANENVGDGALLGHLLEGILQSGAIVYRNSVSLPGYFGYCCLLDLGVLTNLIHLNDVGVCALLAQERFRSLAVGAVGLAEDGCSVRSAKGCKTGTARL